MGRKDVMERKKGGMESNRGLGTLQDKSKETLSCSKKTDVK